MVHRTTIAISFVLGGLFAIDAAAFYPVDGWWWNPNESGRGFNIEMQDDEMFIAAFHYRDNGEPVWWVTNGRYNDLTGRMSGTFFELDGGQCPGCPYSAPEVIDGAGSPVSITFHSAVTATLNWDGESIPLQRHYWRFALDQPNVFLFGEFHFTAGALGLYFGDRIYFNDTMTSDDGTEFLTGRVRGGSSQRIAVGRFDPDTGVFAILLDSSPSFYALYAFDMTKDRLEGNRWVYEKDDNPTGSGLQFIGHRVASRAFVQTGVGPHSLERPSDDRLEQDQEDRDQQIMRLQQYLKDRDISAHSENSHAIGEDLSRQILGKPRMALERFHARLQLNH